MNEIGKEEAFVFFFGFFAPQFFPVRVVAVGVWAAKRLATTRGPIVAKKTTTPEKECVTG